MKQFELPRINRHLPIWTKLATAGLLSIALAGCGGGSDGANGTPGAPGAPGTPGAPGAPGTNASVLPTFSNLTAATPAAAAAWAALAPQVTVTGVTIASPPEVKFTVKDAAGNAVLGLGGKSQSATTSVAGLTNLAFTLAKLVPGTNNEPSKWVSYNVIRVPTVAEKAGTVAATTSCDSTTAPTWCGTYPATDSQGTLVDNGDGSYTYTFLRDPKQAKAIVATLIDTANGLNKKADLGDLTFDATLTHRLGIQLGGNAPGTGSNTPTAATLIPAVAIGHAANVVYDFRPDGAAVTATRNIVKLDSCSNCHDGKVLAHGSRLDPEYCMTCHTDQIKYSFSMEAPATGLALTGGTTGTTAQKRAETAVVDGRAIGNFPNFMHKLHMGSKLLKTGYNYNANGGAMQFNTVKYPQEPTNCVNCHDGSATAVNKTANGDNWKSVPSLLACGACHDGINFATGQGKSLSGALTGHIGGAKADNATCVLCHDASANAAIHNAKMPASADAAKRSMSSKINSVKVDATTGNVVVNFNVTDAGVAVTDIAKFTKPSFSLVKLAPAKDGASSHWVSYTSRFRTKDATQAPVLQASNENSGTLVANADGTFSYTFALITGSTAGDIRTVSHAHNTSTVAPYSGTAWTGTGATDAGTGVNVVAYEPLLTHRVSMAFKAIASNVDNATNAYKDFVPGANGLGTGAVTSTRNIVTMETCATCHAGVKLHSGYATEYCAGCHNSGTADPFTGETVDLQRLVHNIHMGKGLPSVIAGGSYVVNGSHDYSKAGYPGVIKDCVVCHSETAVLPGTTTKLQNAANWRTMPTKAACSTCHDSAVSLAHITQNVVGAVETCVTCHAPGKVADIAVSHAVIK